MRLFLWAIPVLVGCTLISDADQFVGDGGADAEGVDVPVVVDAGGTDTGEGPESCAARVQSTSGNTWQQGRCCFSNDHCAGLMFGGMADDGRCLPDSCGADTPLASICLPSLEAIRAAEGGENSCYLNVDCAGRGGVCMLGSDEEYASATCGADMPPQPGICMEME